MPGLTAPAERAHTDRIEHRRIPPAERCVRLDIEHRRSAAPCSPRSVEVCFRYGIRPESHTLTLGRDIPLPREAPQVIAVVGPSGAGKTSLLHAIGRRFDHARHMGRTRFPRKPAIIDAVARGRTLPEAASILTACGLGEPRLWIRRYEELSDGERFRAKLARSLGLHLRGPDPTAPLLCDEFAAGLHRRAARSIAFNLAKLARRRGLYVAAAVAHEDLLGDLGPSLIIRLGAEANAEAIWPRPDHGLFSGIARLHIEPGRKADYDRFAPMHYRRRDELGFVDKVFVAREGVGGEPVGIVVYAYGPLELALRNRATGGRFRGAPKRLNRELRILRRLVIHPDLRGCGVGHWLVRETLPMVGVDFVECLATLGQINPVFEKAGMSRVGTCPPPRGHQRLLSWLRRQGADPFAADFETQLAACPAVQGVVADVVRGWYRATTGARRDRVASQSPRLLAQTFRQLACSQPVYYLWHRDGRRFEPPSHRDLGSRGTSVSPHRQES